MELPRELLALAFEHLDVESILAASLVCVEWYHVSNQPPVWKRKCKEGVKKAQWKALQLLKEQEGLSWKETYQYTVHLFPESAILGAAEKKALGEWLGDSAPFWRLRYRASRDGFSHKRFHELCDDVGPTVCIGITHAEPKSYVYGGYNPSSWKLNSKPSDPTDEDPHNRTFIFSMHNPHGICPVRMFPKRTGRSQAWCYSPSYGPLFGTGYDLGMMNHPYGHDDSAWCRLGTAYPVPEQYKGNPHHFLAPTREFKLDEMEVYTLQMPNPQ
ncbi:TLDc domain-containing protein [Balamuthia mandrillaris]